MNLELFQGNHKIDMIYTLGHSRHSLEWFISLLKRYQVTTVVDVRRIPYSKMAPQFNRDRLKAALETGGIKYLYRGKSLGGQPRRLIKDDEISRQFTERERLPDYLNTIQWLIRLGRREQVALICAEANPRACHRHHLIARSLLQRGETITHILKNGEVDRPDLSQFKSEAEQLELF